MQKFLLLLIIPFLSFGQIDDDIYLNTDSEILTNNEKQIIVKFKKKKRVIH